jgi:hypothetical protein
MCFVFLTVDSFVLGIISLFQDVRGQKLLKIVRDLD